MLALTKTCSRCKQTFPADPQHFYRHPRAQHGLQPTCKSCTNDVNKISAAKRKALDPDGERAKGTARSKKHYHANLDDSRAYQRQAAAKYRANPERRNTINVGKRAGGARLTPDAFAELLSAQGGKCAICFTQEPSKHTGSKGWNLDHCHKSGKVRFILCSGCNRGLGAFRDNPDTLRRAADLLDDIVKESAQ